MVFHQSPEYLNIKLGVILTWLTLFPCLLQMQHMSMKLYKHETRTTHLSSSCV